MRKKLGSFLLILGIWMQANTLFAQDSSGVYQTVSNPESKAPVAERDLTDMILRFRYTKKQLCDLDTNGEKKKSHFAAVPAAGYSLQTGFAVIMAANGVFHTGNHETTKASSVFTCISFTQYRQIIFPIIASIWTPHNKYHIVSDNRYLKYPSLTFGTGSNALETKGYALDYFYLKMHETVLRKVMRNVYAGVGIYYDYFWDIHERINTKHKGKPEPLPFTIEKEEKAVGYIGIITYDNRPRLINPSNGLYASFLYRNNPTSLGSQKKWSSGLLELRKYFTLPGRAKNVLAFWNYNWFTVAGDPGYLLLPSTGWDDYFNTGRGYIQGRFRGKDMVYLEGEYRYKILRNGLLGGVLFGNMQYFSGSAYTSDWVVVPGGGIGLRLKLNKRSATNLAVDYGFGLNGSKGFFVNLGEAF